MTGNCRLLAAHVGLNTGAPVPEERAVSSFVFPTLLLLVSLVISACSDPGPQGQTHTVLQIRRMRGTREPCICRRDHRMTPLLVTSVASSL